MTGFSERLRENLYVVACRLYLGYPYESTMLVRPKKINTHPTACSQPHVPNLLFRFRRWRSPSQRVRLWREDPPGGYPTSISESDAQA